MNPAACSYSLFCQKWKAIFALNPGTWGHWVRDINGRPEMKRMLGRWGRHLCQMLFGPGSGAVHLSCFQEDEARAALESCAAFGKGQGWQTSVGPVAEYFNAPIGLGRAGRQTL
jgi:hypothetical protein